MKHNDTPATLNLDSVDTFNKAYGFTTVHPLVSVFDMNEATDGPVGEVAINYGLYALMLKNGVNCTVRYGRKKCDYQEGTIVSFAPGQTVQIDIPADRPKAHDVKGIVFHPDLIYGTSLAEKIAEFSFFDYTDTEALHLSERERAIFLDCLDKIRLELQHDVDPHSAPLISANIQLMLEYLHRFYDRQFVTRHKVNSEVVANFERSLKSWFADRANTGKPMPTVAEFADRAALSPGYFGELVKRETGRNAKDIITDRMVAEAKHRLMTTDKDVATVAYELGFEYPAHFTRIFKRITGQSPTQFRAKA